MNKTILYCPKCGLELKDGAEYCEVCGTSAQAARDALNKRITETYARAIHKAPSTSSSNSYQYDGAGYQTTYPKSNADRRDDMIAELSRKIDMMQSNQFLLMKNTEAMLKKHSKKRSTCIAVLSIFLGIFILACVILTFILIFVTSDTVKTIINIIDEIYGLLVNYEGQLNKLMDVVSGMIG